MIIAARNLWKLHHSLTIANGRASAHKIMVPEEMLLLPPVYGGPAPNLKAIKGMKTLNSPITHETVAILHF